MNTAMTLSLTEEERRHISLALHFERVRIERLIEEEDTPMRRANLALTMDLIERVSLP